MLFAYILLSFLCIPLSPANTMCRVFAAILCVGSCYDGFRMWWEHRMQQRGVVEQFGHHLWIYIVRVSHRDARSPFFDAAISASERAGLLLIVQLSAIAVCVFFSSTGCWNSPTHRVWSTQYIHGKRRFSRCLGLFVIRGWPVSGRSCHSSRVWHSRLILESAGSYTSCFFACGLIWSIKIDNMT